MYKDKNLVIGVTGGIAIYKTLDVISALRKLDFNIDVIMTKHAQEFIRPLTFSSMTNRPVVTDMFAEVENCDIEHIALAKKADLFCIIPATANVIGKIANGIADDMLTTTIMATKAPILIAPAMNSKMYENPIVQENMEKLRRMGMHFIDPAAGRLACGDEGFGKLASPEDIVEKILTLIEKRNLLEGKKILISAGPTLERIDPVRFISNHSSGKMGYALAKSAYSHGAEVRLISGPVKLSEPIGTEVTHVETSEEMYDAIMANAQWADVIIKSAAVMDYKPLTFEKQKIKKTEGLLKIDFDRTKDILYELGKIKKEQLLVGFAAETENVIENAKEKLIRKNADMIVANDVSNPEIGFKSDMNEVYLVTKDQKIEKISISSKDEIADKIIKKVIDMIK
jgi:phosphopantothenoylcysteine decarboxylase/phosphopantothenate--cysteine ligase